MNSQVLWQIFIETGAPEAYVLFNQARRMEENHVYNDQSVGASDHRLQ